MKDFFEFLKIAEKLKSEKRANKLSNGEYESVASHSWMMGLFALLFHNKLENKIDIGRVLQIILVHDLAESIAGDIPIHEQCAEDKCKIDAEKAAIDKITSLLSSEKKQEILSLWQEYEDNKTPEAKFAKACDKLEALAQSLMFNNVGYWRDYDPDFYYDCALNERRENFWAHEPILKEFSKLMCDITKARMESEGIDYKKYMRQES